MEDSTGVLRENLSASFLSDIGAFGCWLYGNGGWFFAEIGVGAASA